MLGWAAVAIGTVTTASQNVSEIEVVLNTHTPLRLLASIL